MRLRSRPLLPPGEPRLRVGNDLPRIPSRDQSLGSQQICRDLIQGSGHPLFKTMLQPIFLTELMVSVTPSPEDPAWMWKHSPRVSPALTLPGLPASHRWTGR